MTDTVIETFHYELEERDDGWWTRFIGLDGAAEREWIGPYPTEEKASSAVKESLEQVLADFTKIALGLS